VKKTGTAVVLLLLASASAWADQGVSGRASHRRETVAGLSVFAYAGTAGADPGATPVASTVTDKDGAYRLALPPGSYTLVARSGKAGKNPRTGEYFCYHSGSPLFVRAGEWTAAGFNLVKVPREERTRAERSALEGTVTYQDRPLEKLYLYLYRDAAGSFRGPGVAAYPVGAGGRFRVGVPPGRYYVIARKRAKGGMYGPVETGDHFAYYPGNPLTVGEKEDVRIALEAVARLSLLEEEGERRAPRMTGRIVDGGGRPVAGVRVFAYPIEGGEGGKGRPLVLGAPSGAAGTFTLEMPRAGSYRLVARERLGGPAASGEWRGEGRGTVPPQGQGDRVEIVVEREP
jgi:hypothetical protein